jgi:hypothetical protein
MRTIGVCAALVLSLAGSTVYGQSYARQVWDQLQTSYTQLQDSDWVLDNYIIGKLARSAKDTWSFSLDSGREYVIVGACDNDCSDLDLRVKDSNGRLIVDDTGVDDRPVTRFRVTSSGRFTVEVEMYACTDAPCFFGFGLFRK